MTEQLDARLELEINDALDRINSELRQALENVLGGAGEVLSASIAEAISSVPPVPLTADASAMPDEILEAITSDTPVVPVDADAADMPGQIEEALAVETPLVPVDADASAIPGEITEAVDAAGGAPVPVDADTSTIGPEITNAIDSVHPEPILIEVDTSDAVASIEDMGNAADVSSGEVKGMGESTKFLEGAAAAGAGSLGGLRTAAEGAGASSLSGYAGVAALALGIGELAHEGINAVSAESRLNAAFGEQAEAVKHVDIGGLTGDLGHLAEKVGTTNAQLDNGLARLGQYGKAAGLSAAETERFAQQASVLALRATAMSPALGSVDEVVQRMSRGLAAGGRFAQQFYLSLDKPDIVARAIELFGGTADSLSKTQLAAAGADLAVGNLGDKLGTDFAEGAASADNQARSVTTSIKNIIEETAKPLVAPFLEVFRQAVPVVAALGAVLGELGKQALPIVADAAAIIVPPLKAGLSVLKELGPVLPYVIAGYLAFKAVGVAATALEVLRTVIIGTIAVHEAEAVSAAGAAAAEVGGAVAAAEAQVASALIIKGAQQSIIAGNAAIEASMGPIGIGIAIIGGLAAAFGLFGGSASDAKTDIKALGEESDATFAKMAQNIRAVQALGSKKGGLYGDLADKATQRSLSDLRDLADQNTDAAQRLGTALRDAGVITEGQFNKAMEHGIKVQADHAKAQQENAAASHVLTAAQQAVAFATDLTSAAADRQSSIHKAAVSAAESLTAAGNKNADAVRNQANAYALATQDATDYKTSLDILNSGTLSLAQAEQSEAASNIALTAALKESKGSLDLNTEAGNKAFSALLQNVQGEQSYEVALRASGASLDAVKVQQQGHTQAIIEYLTAAHATPEVIGAMLTKLGLAPSVIDPATRAMYGLAAVTGTDIPAGTTAATTALSTLTPAMQTAAEGALAAAGTSVPAIRKLLDEQMHQGAKSFAEAINGLPPATATALALAANAANVGMDQIVGVSGVGGKDASGHFKLTYTEGTVEGADAAAAAGASAIRAEKDVVDVSDDWGRRAGRAFGTGMVDGLESKTHQVYAAGQALARAAKSGIDNAGSPSEHLFFDSGILMASAYADGFAAGTPGVVQEAMVATQTIAANVAAAHKTLTDNLAKSRDADLISMRKNLADFVAATPTALADAASSIAFDAANPGSLGAGLNLDFLNAMRDQQSQQMQVDINKVEVQVVGVADPATARAAGQAAAEGFSAQLTEHGVTMSARMAGSTR